MTGLTAHQARTAAHVAMDGAALNRAQHDLLFNPTPEVDSLAERLAALLRDGVPRDTIRFLFENVRELIDLNEAEHGCHTRLAGQLDDLARVLHEAERDTHAAHALGIKALARALRPALDVLSDPAAADPLALVRASRTISAIIERTPDAQLLNASVRHEIGQRRYQALIAIRAAIREAA